MTKTRKMKKQRRAPKGFKRLPIGPSGGVELLLIHSLDHLGSQGDVVEVKRGYAYNYLIPQGLATVATDHHKRMVDKHKEKLEQIAKVKLSQFKDQASEIEKLRLTIEAKANEDGHLYGSVGAADIVNALKQSGVTVTQDQIRLEGVLKELGLYEVKVKLEQEVEAELTVWVVPSVEEEEPAS